jgi:hypothetical protein
MKLDRKIKNLIEDLYTKESSETLNTISDIRKETLLYLESNHSDNDKSNYCIEILKEIELAPTKNEELFAHFSHFGFVAEGLALSKLKSTIEANIRAFNLSYKYTTIKEKKALPTKELKDFIYKIDNKEEFIEALKDEFKTEKGIEIRALIESLKDEGVLIIGNRQFKPLCTSIKESFNRDIGSYNGIQNPKEHEVSNIMSPTKERVKIILDKFK